MRIEAKKTLLAGAVATALGTAATISVADEIMFPYIVGSATVTSIVSIVNTEGTRPGALNPLEKLHYTYFYKSGAAAENNTANCEEVNVDRNTSKDDIVTFDVIQQFGDATEGVLFNDPGISDPQANANYRSGEKFGMLKGREPVRAFLLVDNHDGPAGASPTNNGAEDTLYGEVMIFEFGSGAAWGYRAYNAYPNTTGFRFDDQFERTGEVLGGPPPTAAGGGGAGRAATPTTLLPFNSAAEFTTKFFVTPIYNGDSYDPDTGSNPSQFRHNLSTKVRLCATSSCDDEVMWDRDERPVSGGKIIRKVCVGAIDANEFLTSAAAEEVPDGGWSHVSVQDNGGHPTDKDGVVDTNAAVIYKLDYNKVEGSFNGQSSTRNGAAVGGVFNNAVWLRHMSRYTTSGAMAPYGPGPLYNEWVSGN